MWWRFIASVVVLTGIGMSVRAEEAAHLAYSGRVGLATGLVYRGIDLANDRPVPGLDLAVDHDSGLYLHSWLARVELPRPDYYAYFGNVGHDGMWQGVIDAGYHWRPLHLLTLSLAHNWYLYSDDQPASDPDYREWVLSVDYQGFVALDLAHTGDLWGQDLRQNAVALTGRWPFARQLISTATLGWVDQEGRIADSYSYLRFDIGLLRGDWSLQLQYHNSFNVGGYYAGNAVHGKWVAAIDWHF